MTKASKLGLVAAALIAMAACDQKKVDECNGVISTYNTVGEVMRAGFGDGTDPAAIDTNVKALEGAVAAFDAVKLTDGPITAARDGLSKVFHGYTDDLKSMAGLVREASVPATAEAATPKLEALGARFTATKTALEGAKQTLLTTCNTTAK